jgi:hypothetical protein
MGNIIGGIIALLGVITFYVYIIPNIYVDNISVLLVVWCSIISFVFWWLYPILPQYAGGKLLGYDFKKDVKIVKKNKSIFFISSFIVFCFVWLFYFVFITLPIIVIKQYYVDEWLNFSKLGFFAISPFGMLAIYIPLITFFRKYKPRKKRGTR